MEDQTYEAIINLVESAVSRVSEIPHLVAASKPRTAIAYLRSSRKELKELQVIIDLLLNDK